jgi:hypothetical protein
MESIAEIDEESLFNKAIKRVMKHHNGAGKPKKVLNRMCTAYKIALNNTKQIKKK